MSNKLKSFSYVVVGMAWCLVGVEVVIAGVVMIVRRGKK